MDIFTKQAVDTAIIHVKDAAGELMFADAERTKPCQIEIYGPGSEVAAAVESRQTTRALKRFQDNDGKMSAPTQDEALRESAEDLASITRRFINFTYSPAPTAEGAELFQAVYGDRKLGFVARQIQQAYKDWGKFKSGSAPS
jgi:hypothetical protein